MKSISTSLRFNATLATFSTLAFAAIGRTAPVISSDAKVNQPAHSWVSLKARTDQTRYSIGQPISVHLIATNTHTKGAYLRFSSGQRFDFSVSSPGKKEVVYTWSAVRMFSQMVGSLWLKPGRSQEYETAIGDEMGQLKPGKYLLTAHLTNSPNNIVAAPTSFEVVDSGIVMTAKTDKASYKIGEAVKMDMTVANKKTGINRLPFRSSQIFDVFITDESGNPVWNYSALVRFAQNQHDEVWKKGEIKKYSTTWNGSSLGISPKTSPGHYRVQAVLQSTPPIYAQAVFIDITE